MKRHSWLRALRLGVDSLLLHKLRSFLTTLGVLFGVSSVIAMLAVGEGGQEEALEQITRLGSQNIILRSVKPPDEAVSNQQTRVISYGLTKDDAARIAVTFPGVRRVVPALATPVEVRFDDDVCTPRVLGTLPSYIDVTGREMYQGRFLTDSDERADSSTCVLGYEVARYLFPFESALNRRIKIGPDYFEVVGVLWPRVPVGSLSTDPGAEAGGEVFLPLSTVRSRFGERQAKLRSGSMEVQEVELHEIIVEVERAVDVPMVAEACREMMRRNHAKKDYEVIVPLELLMRAEETKRIFNVVLGSIAGISLLVGGIGIMNVMLATVTERTREIGIRRALGAKRRHIVTQFLIETMVLSGCGGLAGVALGIAIPEVVERFADLRTIVRLHAPILAFAISVGIGVVFGLYPAWRAANMDPVDALRHE